MPTSPYGHYRFIGQSPDEIILYRSHRHWLHFLYIFLRNTFAVAIGMATLNTILYVIMVNIFDYPGGSELMNFLVALFILAILATIILSWTIYYLTVAVLTDRRLIKIVQKSIFYNYSREVKLTGLQDTSFTYRNWVQSVFNYGTLVSHAASGEEGKFELHYIPNPRDLHHFITKILNLVEEGQKSGVKPVLPFYRKKYGRKHMTSGETLNSKS